MPSQQGDIALLNHPVAQELLHSTHLARLAYVWPDGSPRVVPIWFHWTGTEIVLGSFPNAPKLKALAVNPQVALTIDSEDGPAKVLLIRGPARFETVAGVPSEYAAAARRYSGEEQGNAWVEQVGRLTQEMVRIVIQPAWVGILDFQTRLPNSLERALEQSRADA